MCKLKFKLKTAVLEMLEIKCGRQQEPILLQRGGCLLLLLVFSEWLIDC